MDAALCRPSCAEDLTLSQLAFFSVARVYDPPPLPHTPPSVCRACWKGPFARYLGLRSSSKTGDQWYPPWPKRNSYSTSLTKLKSRADAGCVWCWLILDKRPFPRSSVKRLIITLHCRTARWHSSKQRYQRLTVKINGQSTVDGDVATTALGASKNIQVLSSQAWMAS